MGRKVITFLGVSIALYILFLDVVMYRETFFSWIAETWLALVLFLAGGAVFCIISCATSSKKRAPQKRPPERKE